MKQIDPHKVEFLALFNRTFLKDTGVSFIRDIELIESMIKLFDRCFSEGKKVKASQFYDDFFKIIENSWAAESVFRLEDHSQSFLTGLDELIQKLPEKLNLYQGSKRFHIQKEDGVILMFGKGLKIFLYQASMLPRKLMNGIRKLFGKKSKKIKYWKHQVPFRSFLGYSLGVRLIADLSKEHAGYYREAGSQYFMLSQLLLETDHIFSVIGEIDHEKSRAIHQGLLHLKEELEDLQKRTVSLFLTKVNDGFELIQQDIQKVGTIEYYNARLNEKRVTRNRQKVNGNYSNILRSWENTAFAIFDDFRTDTELLELKYLVREATEEIRELLHTDQYLPTREINNLRSHLAELKASIREEQGELRKSIVRVKYNVRKLLTNQIIPDVSVKLISRNLGGLIDNLDNQVTQFASLIERPRVFISSDHYQKPTRSHDLNFVSLSELISFESLPVFQNEVSAIKGDIFMTIEKINESIVNLDDIIDFALEAALSNFDEGLADHQEAYKMSNDAFERAISQLQLLDDEILALNRNKFEEIERAVAEFANSLVSYTENENILALRIRLTKNKAVKKSEEYKDKFLVLGKNVLERGSSLVSKAFGDLIQGVKWLQNRFLLTAPAPVLTREVSDFLFFTHQKIKNLPLIYKNLYQIHPVKDQKLFIGRVSELAKLDQAFKAWQSGNFASTVLIGEKWGGLTSLVNHYMMTRKLNLKVVRIKVEGKLYAERDLLNKLSEAFDCKPVDTFDDLERVIHEFPTRLVIVFEDMQRLFLRTLSGFDTINKLLQLIVRTNEKAYWLSTCTLFAWDYLKKVISIEDYFAHIIVLDKLTDEQIIEIIKIRNKISGVQIEFDPKESDLKNKKFRQRSLAEQQTLLARRYFRSLSEYAESNISLALIFWLISTREFKSNKLVVGPFERPDLSFIKVIAIDRLMIMVSLILHDGLDEFELARANNITLEQAKTSMLFLLEDGIVRKHKERYQVNPVIYRNVITLLKNKNLLQIKS
jgi:hypothetical protein